jgi:hypothetical protein
MTAQTLPPAPRRTDPIAAALAFAITYPIQSAN